MTERQVIDGMLDLLSDESKWTQGAFARDASGTSIEAKRPDACCWCLDGAMMRVAGTQPDRFYASVWCALASATGKRSVATFNDDSQTTFEDVRSLLLKVRDQLDD